MKNYNWNIYWRLTVISDAENVWKNRYANVKCECWNNKVVSISSLVWWATKSCWCLNTETRIKRLKSIPIEWEKFNRITILKEVEWKSETTVLWQCECWTIKEFNYSRLKSWDTKSCWCIWLEIISNLWSSKKSTINKWDKFNSLTILEEVDKINNKRKFLCQCDCWNITTVELSNLKNWHTKTCWLCNWYKTTEKQRVRTSKEYNEWRTKCFERDNYTCQISWQKWWNLVVHHLTPYYTLFNDINWKIEYNNLIFDISNWITITDELHREFHLRYSNKNFSKEDFYKFLNETKGN